jgi:hypothetical protein
MRQAAQKSNPLACSPLVVFTRGAAPENPLCSQLDAAATVKEFFDVAGADIVPVPSCDQYKPEFPADSNSPSTLLVAHN